ncbi:hypothetical protein DEO72_LG8g1562 [Vigna unguiculata]|uniref:Uncharacterized protein n=1 Tax=Vigna unguiculata TaxID=3917 RepID=A0A4D6MUH3_VIGUN|nr:hypothetical protein DEO72_LG8g1562 [Vigna unguiculata]
MHGTYYPDLLRVFYYNLKIRDEVALSKNQFSMGLMASIESWPINLSYATQHRMLGDNYWLED